MLNKKAVGFLSLSLASVASGAFASIDNDILDNHNSFGNDVDNNISSKLVKNTDIDGVKYAKRYNPTYVGTNNSAGSATSGGGVVENCYSNCHDTPTCVGYNTTTACPTGYTQSFCPTSTAVWNCTCYSDTATQCINNGYNQTTACSTGYTTDVCTLNSSYWKCTCHADNCPTYKTNTDNARSALVTAITGPKTSTGTISGLSNVSGVFTLSTTPNATDTTDANNIISKYNAYTSAASTYNSSCSPAYSNAYSCYSNCHSEVVTCPAYLASQGVPVISDGASLLTALSSGSSVMAVLSDTSVSGGMSIGSKKLVGPKYFTASAECTALSTPTFTVTNNSGDGITLASGGGIDKLNIAYSTTSTSTPSAISGSGYLSNVTLSGSAETYLLHSTGDIDISGPVTINTTANGDSYVDDYGVYIDAGARMDVTSNLVLNGDAAGGSNILGTMNISSAGSYTSNGSAYYAMSVGTNGILTADGVLKILGSPTYGIDGGFSGGTTSVKLNASGNIVNAQYKAFDFTDGTFYINGSTTINMSGSSTSKTAFSLWNVYSGSNALGYVNAPVTITGLTSSSSEGFLYAVGGELYVASTINSTTNAPLTVYGMAGLHLTSSSSAISGVSAYKSGYDTSVLEVVSGAKMTVGGTCKKATVAKTNTGVIAVTTTPPTAVFAGSC